MVFKVALRWGCGFGWAFLGTAGAFEWLDFS